MLEILDDILVLPGLQKSELTGSAVCCDTVSEKFGVQPARNICF